jgi:hypothetical protein
VTFHSLPIDQDAVGSDGCGWVVQTMKCHKGFLKHSSLNGEVRTTFDS